MTHLGDPSKFYSRIAGSLPKLVSHDHELQVILSLLDNWSNPGGIDQIVAWSGTAKGRTEFFTDANCMDLYRQHVSTVLRRVNSINGRK